MFSFSLLELQAAWGAKHERVSAEKMLVCMRFPDH